MCVTQNKLHEAGPRSPGQENIHEVWFQDPVHFIDITAKEVSEDGKNSKMQTQLETPNPPRGDYLIQAPASHQLSGRPVQTMSHGIPTPITAPTT